MSSIKQIKCVQFIVPNLCHIWTMSRDDFILVHQCFTFIEKELFTKFCDTNSQFRLKPYWFLTIFTSTFSLFSNVRITTAFRATWTFVVVHVEVGVVIPLALTSAIAAAYTTATWAAKIDALCIRSTSAIILYVISNCKQEIDVMCIVSKSAVEVIIPSL